MVSLLVSLVLQPLRVADLEELNGLQLARLTPLKK
jgi:hypothetical protein